ncbi:MAG: MerR family transcriptional regulator [Thermodesulfobacteriota bacterium]
MKKQKLLKMKELAEITGVSGGTIRYYIHQGVLPHPVKTHKNMAYYDESYIERIRVIKELQKTRFLPLDIIKTLLADMDFSNGGDSRALVREIDKPLFENGHSNGKPPSMSAEELSHHTGLTPEEIADMVRLEMILPGPEGRFDGECIRLTEIVAELRKVGLSQDLNFQVEHLRVHLDLIEFLARKEVELFSKRIAGKGIDRDTASKLARDAIGVINKLLPILHLRMIQKIFEEAE